MPDACKVKAKNLHTSVSRSEQKTALTEEMLRRISPQRLQRSVATVRGWLKSPTPSEASSAAIIESDRRGRLQQNLSYIPMPKFADSLRDTEKLYVPHRHVFSLPDINTPEMPSEVINTKGLSYPQVTNTVNQSDSLGGLTSKTHESFGEEKKMASPVSVLDGPMRELKEHVRLPLVPNNIWGSNLSCLEDEHTSISKCHVSSSAISHVEKQSGPLGTGNQGRTPALRILKRGNLKIADLLISDSEEDFTS